MKRVAFVIATLNTGGAERTVSNIVTHLPEDYVADILLNDTHDIFYPYKGNIISLNMKPKANKVDLWYQFKVLVKRIHVLKKIKRENHYEAVLSFSDTASIANILTGNKHCKIIVSVRNNLTKSEKVKIYKYVLNPLCRRLYNKADKVVTLSKGVELDLIRNLKLNPDVVATIYNGIDSRFVFGRLKEQDIKPDHQQGHSVYTLVTMGRLAEQKGQWHLIRALSLLKQKNLDFKLFILGEGLLRTYLTKLTMELGLKDNVVFCGFCENPFKILTQADIYVFPSMYEGFGNSLLEAMCCGLPCIATDYDSGAREILAPDTDITYKNTGEVEYAQYGVIVPVCDGKHYTARDALTYEEQLLGNAIYELLTDNERYAHYKANLKKRVAQFDINAIVQEWLNVIEN